jgi:hypothetical protein
MGPAVFDLLMAGENRAAEDVFLDCKKGVDANKHALDKAVSRRTQRQEKEGKASARNRQAG